MKWRDYVELIKCRKCMFSKNILILWCQPLEGVRGRQIPFFFLLSDLLMTYLFSKGHKKTLAPEKYQCDFDRLHLKS